MRITTITCEGPACGIYEETKSPPADWIQHKVSGKVHDFCTVPCFEAWHKLQPRQANLFSAAAGG